MASDFDEAEERKLVIRGAKLSDQEAERLENDFEHDPGHYDSQIQLVAYYKHKCIKFTGSKLIFKKKMLKIAYWLISNEPDLKGFLRHAMMKIGATCSPDEFAQIRELWIEQIARHPHNSNPPGNASLFLGWRNLERAEKYVRLAMSLEPTEHQWPAGIAAFLYYEYARSPELYKKHYAKLAVEFGLSAIRLGPQPPYFDVAYTAECAIYLNQLELATSCAEFFNIDDLKNHNYQTGFLLQGLIALKKHNKKEALKHLTRFDDGYLDRRIFISLASELYEAGERDRLIHAIKQFPSKISKRARQRWIYSIEGNKLPNFDDF